MAIQAKLVGRFAQLGVVVCAVHIMAREAGDAATIHHALHKIVSLHAIFVGGAVGIMRESSFAQSVLFELPKIAQVETDTVADGPVVIFAVDRTGERAPLRVTLDAGVVALDVIHARGI